MGPLAGWGGSFSRTNYGRGRVCLSFRSMKGGGPFSRSTERGEGRVHKSQFSHKHAETPQPSPTPQTLKPRRMQGGTLWNLAQCNFKNQKHEGLTQNP